MAGLVVLAAAGAGAAVWLLSEPSPPSADAIAAARQTTVVHSEAFVIEDKYRSMMGPKGVVEGTLAESDPPELLWVTGYRAVMIDPTTEAEVPQEYMCHANLNLDAAAHRERFGGEAKISPRLFTLSQGQSHVRFPAGFGIPMMSDEPLSVEMQVLNLNYEGPPLPVQHEVTIEYVRERDLDAPMRPLLMRAAAGLVTLEPKPADWGETHAAGEGCMPGERAGGKVRRDKLGRQFTGHWIVPPGRQVTRTRVTKSLALPFDTKVHYVAAHVHPFAESIALHDVTADEDVFVSLAKNFTDRIGLEHVDHYESLEGFEVFADHEYEVVAVYDNTSGEPQDSMAVLFLYLLDRAYEAPEGT